MAEERDRGAGLVAVGGVGGTLIGALIATLLAAKPAAAAPPDEKIDYLIECLTALVPVLAEVAENNAQLITLLEQWLAAQGVAPGVEVTVKAPWVAKEPEVIFDRAITSAATFDADKMVNWTRGKRLVIRVESLLDEDCDIQVVGNITDSYFLATDINAPIPCLAHGHTSIGLAWDDWFPFIGVRITTAIAPTSGLLTVSVVIQE
ncbi:hypothetical protein ES708_34404 [subsurface metagenome]